MFNKKRKEFESLTGRRLALSGLLSFSAAACVLTSCHGSMSAERHDLSKVEYAKEPTYKAQSAAADPSSGSQVSYEVNIQKEQAVADGCLKAWRKAVREKDEDGAMKLLEELDKKYAGISSVQFMMGQVKEHFGKHKEATEHFKRAHSTNEFSSMQTFKLAESMRKSGDSKGSIVYYQKLLANLERATGEYGLDHMKSLLSSVRLGLAHAHKDCNETDQAKAMVNKVLKDDANNAEAKSLLKELERTGN